MNEFVIDTSTVTIKDQDDNVLVEGKLLDLHFTQADIVTRFKEGGKTQEETFTEVARVFQEKFQPNGDPTEISWATAMKIAIEVHQRIDTEKKS